MRGRNKPGARAAALALALLAFMTCFSAVAGDWAKDGSYTGAVTVLEPTASNTGVFRQSDCVVDYSNASDGYIMIKYTGQSGSRLKAQVTKSGGKTYNYDLAADGKFIVVPLQSGSGTYGVGVYKNLAGTKYSQLAVTTVNVKLESEFGVFLRPNQYVNFSSASAAARKSYELCRGASTDLDKLAAVLEYIVDNIDYDDHKAKTVATGYLPDCDETLATNKGICFDYSVLLAVMLRTQGVPVKLVIGSTAKVPDHAWNEIYIEGQGWITAKIKVDEEGWKSVDSTFVASGSAAKGYTAARIY